MHEKNPVRSCAVGVLLCLLGGISSVQAQPPKINLEELSKRDRLTRGEKEQVRGRIKYWLKIIRTAEKPTEIIKGARGLLQDYQDLKKKPRHQYTFASLVSEEAVPVFKQLGGQHRLLRETNLALALSQMPQLEIQKALEEMIVHRNPAVRFYGWRGYRRLREQVLIFGSRYTDKMYRSMRTRATEETSAPVVTALFQAIYMPPVPPPGVSIRSFLQYQRSAFEILKGCWIKRCKEVWGGNGGIADASRKGVAGLANFVAVFKNDKAKRTDVLQMAINMAYCSAKAFDEALKKIREAEKKEQKNYPAVEARDACAQLLRDCENTLNYVTGEQRRFISRPLSNPDEEDPGLAVRMGVLEWIAVLKDEGLTDPEKIFKPEPKTRPVPKAKTGT
jgi:hypothetical protein